MQALITIGVVVLVAGAIARWGLDDCICAELRKAYPAIWQALGSPDRYFDDFGLARYLALEQLTRDRELLSCCEGSIRKWIHLRRGIGRIWLAFAVVTVAISAIWVAAR